jgi:hypothetical protein
MFEADIGLATGDSIQVSGIHYTSAGDIEVSGSFKVTGTDISPWTSRPSYSHTPDAGITNTYTYSPGTATPTTWSSMRQLRGKQAMYSYSATGSTVTITFSAAHKFKVDDVISVDLNVEKPILFGLDGIYKVATVTSTTLTYELSTALDIPINTKVVTGTLYVFPMAHKYVREGATWADSANNKTWYWDGLRWIDYSSVANPVRDGDPPAAPSGFSATSEGVVVGTNSVLPLSKITLSWTPPTLTKAGKTLDDLVGYTIKWRKTVNEAWKSKVIKDQVTSYTFDSDVLFEQNQKYYFQLTAFDSGLQDSDPVTTDITTATKTTTLTSARPSAPTLISRLGVMTVKWDGYLDTTPLTLPPGDAAYLQVHYSTTSNFTPSDSTLKETITATKNNFSQFSDLTYGVTYYFKFVLRDTSGQSSLASTQSSSQITPLVDTDIIGKVISGAKIVDGSITASDAIIANTITGGLLKALTIEAGSIKANAITTEKLDVGAVTAEKITGRTITGDKVSVTTSFTFATDASGAPARSIYLGDHVVPGYNGNVTVTGLSFYQSGGRTGIMGTSQWSNMAYGADEIANALSYVNLGGGTFDTYLRSTGAIIISASSGTSVYGGLSSYGYSYFTSGVGLAGGITFNGGEVAVLSNAGTGASAGFRIFTNNPAAFGIWADETYRSGTTTTAAKTAALLHADTGTMTLRTKNVVVTSTRTSKDDIANYPMDLRILDLNPVTFRYKNPGGQKLNTQLGLIAEEVDDLGIDLLVLRDEDGNPTAIDYMKIPVLLTPIIRDLRARVVELESRLSE